MKANDYTVAVKFNDHSMLSHQKYMKNSCPWCSKWQILVQTVLKTVLLYMEHGNQEYIAAI